MAGSLLIGSGNLLGPSADVCLAVGPHSLASPREWASPRSQVKGETFLDVLPDDLIDRILQQLDLWSLAAVRGVSKQLCRAATAQITELKLPAVRVAETDTRTLERFHALRGVEMDMQINKIIHLSDFAPAVLPYVTTIRASIDRRFLSPLLWTELHMLPKLSVLDIMDDADPTDYLRVLPQCTSIQSFRWSSSSKQTRHLPPPLPLPALGTQLTSLELLNCDALWEGLFAHIPACTALRSLSRVPILSGAWDILCTCTGLTRLDIALIPASHDALNQSQQSVSVSALRALPLLQDVTIASQRNSPQPEGLCHLSSLRSLHLDMDYRPHCLATEVPFLTQLTRLNIAKMKDTLASIQLTGLTGLHDLGVHSMTAFCGSGLGGKAGHAPVHIRSLYIDNVSLFDIPAALQPLTALQLLEDLHLTAPHQDVLVHGLAFTERMPQLTKLEFRTGTLYDRVSGAIAGLPKLHPVSLEEDPEQRLYFFGDRTAPTRFPKRWGFWQRRIGSWVLFPSKHKVV
eukprot:jgi/Botrbrau1/9512/Bobra.0211s0003.1